MLFNVTSLLRLLPPPPRGHALAQRPNPTSRPSFVSPSAARVLLLSRSERARRSSRSLVEMRLLTHNFLASNVKGVSSGYPLGLEIAKTSIKEVELNADFIRGILPKLDWRALVSATSAAGFPELLPLEPPPEAELFAEGAAEVEGSALRRLHHALLEIHVEEGTLVCPDSARCFPIQKGVPNMLLNEDEVPR